MSAKIELRIQNHADRQNAILALVGSGHTVRQFECKTNVLETEVVLEVTGPIKIIWESVE